MAKLRIQDLDNRDFEISKLEPPIVQGQDLQRALSVVRSKQIFVEFDQTIDGPQTAARLIREAMVPHGASFVSTHSVADAAVWIGGTSQMAFAFVVFDPKDRARDYHCYLCGAPELTAAIMTTVAMFFHLEPTSQDAAMTISEVARLNAELLARVSAGGPTFALGKMRSLAAELLALRGNSDIRSIKAAADALADAARARGHGLNAPECVEVYDSASAVLVQAGAAARLFISRLAHDAEPCISKAFGAVIARIESGSAQGATTVSASFAAGTTKGARVNLQRPPWWKFW